jgi:hypothetical protein
VWTAFGEATVIPNRSDACWRNIATGKKAIQTQTLGLQLIMKRIQRAIAAEPGEAAIGKGAEDIYCFFEKYESILANEIKSLKG